MKVFIGFLFLVVLINSHSIGDLKTTNCDQRFELFGMTGSEDPTFWFRLDSGGECQYSSLIQVLVSNGHSHEISTLLKNYEGWDVVREALKDIQFNPALKLQQANGIWTHAELDLGLKNPEFDEKFDAEFEDHIMFRGNGGSSWNEEKGRLGIDLPVMTGSKLELIHYRKAGLYKNYEIAGVYFFQSTKMFVVLTHQQRFAVGLDTQHGFLILKQLS